MNLCMLHNKYQSKLLYQEITFLFYETIINLLWIVENIDLARIIDYHLN